MFGYQVKYNMCRFFFCIFAAEIFINLPIEGTQIDATDFTETIECLHEGNGEEETTALPDVNTLAIGLPIVAVIVFMLFLAVCLICKCYKKFKTPYERLQ